MTAAETTPAPSPSPGGSSTSSGLVAVGLLIGLTVLGGLAVLAVRKRMLAHHADDSSESFLDDLRAMHREGRLSQVEFDAAKRAMLEKLRASGAFEKRTERPNR